MRDEAGGVPLLLGYEVAPDRESLVYFDKWPVGWDIHGWKEMGQVRERLRALRRRFKGWLAFCGHFPEMYGSQRRVGICSFVSPEGAVIPVALVDRDGQIAAQYVQERERPRVMGKNAVVALRSLAEGHWPICDRKRLKVPGVSNGNPPLHDPFLKVEVSWLSR